jgi:hypothetical protein
MATAILRWCQVSSAPQVFWLGGTRDLTGQSPLPIVGFQFIPASSLTTLSREALSLIPPIKSALIQTKQKRKTQRVRQNPPAIARTWATMGKDLIQPSADALQSE